MASIATVTAAALSAAICSQDGCDEPAVCEYEWDWGERGTCCVRHRFVLSQTARNLKRNITFHPIQGADVKPLERTERTQLIAEKLSAEAELAEAKSRGLTLFKSNSALADQLRAAMARQRALEESVAVLEERLTSVTEQRDVLHADLADANDELQKLRTFVDTAGDTPRSGA